MFPWGRGLPVTKGWGKAGQETRTEVETVPRSASVGKAAWAWSLWGVRLSGMQLSGSQSLKRLSEIFGSAPCPFLFEAVSVCDSDILGTRCDSAAVKQPPDLLA